MNLDTCIICFADDIEMVEYLNMPLEKVLVLTNQTKTVLGRQTEIFSLAKLDYILQQRHSINRFIITQNANSNHGLILKLLNTLLLYSKTIHNYHSITEDEKEALDMVARNSGGVIRNYSVSTQPKDHHIIYTEPIESPLLFSIHMCENLSMMYYMSVLVEVLKTRGYKVEHITNSPYYDMFETIKLPDSLYDPSVSRIMKSAIYKDFINSTTSLDTDLVVCTLEYCEKSMTNKLSRDFVEEMMYICRPDYVAIGVTDDMCEQSIINGIISYIKKKCNVECDMIVQTPYIRNPYVNDGGYYRIDYSDMSCSKLDNIISIGDCMCYNYLADSVINKLANQN